MSAGVMDVFLDIREQDVIDLFVVKSFCQHIRKDIDMFLWCTFFSDSTRSSQASDISMHSGQLLLDRFKLFNSN